MVATQAKADAAIEGVVATQAKADDAIAGVAATQAKADEAIEGVARTQTKADEAIERVGRTIVPRRRRRHGRGGPGRPAGAADRRLRASRSPPWRRRSAGWPTPSSRTRSRRWSRLIDRLPQLVTHLDEDILPVLESLGNVGTDVHDLVDTVQDLRQVVKGFPGSRLFRRRGAEEIAEEEAAGADPARPEARRSSRAARRSGLRSGSRARGRRPRPARGLAVGQPLELGHDRRPAPGGRGRPRRGRRRCSGSPRGPASGPVRRGRSTASASMPAGVPPTSVPDGSASMSGSPSATGSGSRHSSARVV